MITSHQYLLTLILSIIILVGALSLYVVADTQTDVSKFLVWLERNEAYMNPKIAIKELDNYGRSIVSTKKILKEELLISIPKSIIMGELGISKYFPKDLLDILEEAQISQTDRQAVYLIYSYLNNQSFWYPYVKLMPQTFTTSIYFNQEELDELQASPLLEYTEMRNQGIQHHYELTIVERLSKLHPEFDPNKYTFSLFKWALSCVWSRAFSLSNRDGGMVPLADMFNADTVLSRTKVKPVVTTDKLDYYASGDIEEDEQIFTPYGVYKSVGSTQMLMDYGFIHPDGANGDSTIVSVPQLDEDESNIDLKFQLFEFNNITSNEFTIVKNKLPKQLLRFARIKMISNKEVVAAESHFQTLSTLDKPLTVRNEKAALRYLITIVNKHIDQYPTSLEFDKSLLSTLLSNNSKVSENKLNAIRIRIMEKEILSDLVSALETLREESGNTL